MGDAALHPGGQGSGILDQCVTPPVGGRRESTPLYVRKRALHCPHQVTANYLLIPLRIEMGKK